MLASKRFLARGEARKHLAQACRQSGDDTLAVLELQFYLRELSPEDDQNRLWAEERLKEIRENHEGPLHDCAERARSLSERMAVTKVGAETQEGQKEVEDILLKVAALLEDMVNRCSSCGKKPCGGNKKCKACQGGKSCKKGGCKPCPGSGTGSGSNSAQSERGPSEETDAFGV